MARCNPQVLKVSWGTNSWSRNHRHTAVHLWHSFSTARQDKSDSMSSALKCFQCLQHNKPPLTEEMFCSQAKWSLVLLKIVCEFLSQEKCAFHSFTVCLHTLYFSFFLMLNQTCTVLGQLRLPKIFRFQIIFKALDACDGLTDSHWRHTCRFTSNTLVTSLCNIMGKSKEVSQDIRKRIVNLHKWSLVSPWVQFPDA